MYVGVGQYQMSKLDGDWLLKEVLVHDTTAECILIHVAT